MIGAFHRRLTIGLDLPARAEWNQAMGADIPESKELPLGRAPDQYRLAHEQAPHLRAGPEVSGPTDKEPSGLPARLASRGDRCCFHTHFSALARRFYSDEVLFGGFCEDIRSVRFGIAARIGMDQHICGRKLGKYCLLCRHHGLVGFNQ